MKTRLNAALALLKSAASDVRPGGRGEIDYKQALVEIQGAIDAPEPEAKTVIHTEVVTAEVEQQVATNIQTILDTVTSSLSGLTSRLANVESAAASILTVSDATAGKVDALAGVTQATLDHVDGFQDVLGVIVSNTTPAEPAPAP